MHRDEGHIAHSFNDEVPVDSRRVMAYSSSEFRSKEKLELEILWKEIKTYCRK